MSQRVSDPDLQVSGVPTGQYQAAALSCCPRGVSSWEVGALCSLCEAGAPCLGTGLGSARLCPLWGPQGCVWGLWAPGDAGVDPQYPTAQGRWGHRLGAAPPSISPGACRVSCGTRCCTGDAVAGVTSLHQLCFAEAAQKASVVAFARTENCKMSCDGVDVR